VSALPRPASLVAERAVRLLRSEGKPVRSVRLAREVLATNTANEVTARKVLEAAFAGDPRLVHGRAGWSTTDGPAEAGAVPGGVPDEDRALVLIQGRRPGRGQPYEITNVSVLRLQGDEVVAACGGDAATGPSSEDLRRAIFETIEGTAIIVHDPPGSLSALDRWLGEPLPTPISLRRLAQARLGLPASHDLTALSERLGVHWRETDDPLDSADAVDACLSALRRPGESLHDLRIAATSGAPPIDWSRYEFDRSFLRRLPRVAGTYRFFDADGRLLYVGKSKDLNRRIGSYFREQPSRSRRVQQLLDRLHRIEYEAVGSELEAILREAEQIRRDEPEKNVQRRHHPAGRSARLRSILILEPAEPPSVLRAFLVHKGRLVGRVSIGPRGGGLKRIERVLDDYFFFAPDGPTPAAGPDVDVELVVRWLSQNRERAVAFDPTNLCSAQEVTDRLRWFLAQGTPFDPEGRPIF